MQKIAYCLVYSCNQYKLMIKAWRLHMGLTQKKVAQKARITQAALSQMERTENQNKTATLEKLAAALNVSVEQLTD
jgi:transcriptional regulator with XRE-family HTH domain